VDRRTLVLRFALVWLVVLSMTSPASAGGPEPAPAADVDVQPRPLAWIRPGTVIGAEAPQGWTHLVLLAKPRLGAGDVDSVPKVAAQYSNMFLFALLAKVNSVRTADGLSYYLEHAAMGSALEVKGKTVIATSEKTFGKDLGFIGRRVFQETETILGNDIRQVARTPTMLVFDVSTTVLYHQEHSRMVIRHVILVSPRDGTLSTLVWLLGSDGHGGYALAERNLQMLPPNLREDRVLSVDSQKFTLGIPSTDAFALVRIPQGAPVRFAKALIPAAVVRRFAPESARQLESVLQASYAPLASKVAGRSVTQR
jgi:hypothetical protein